MRVVGIAASAVLALGAWWWIDWRPQGGGVVLAARTEAPSPHVPGPATPEPLRAPTEPVKPGWVQSAVDKAWCDLPVPQATDQDPPLTHRELQRAREASTAQQALTQEMDRLKSDWTTRLRARGDERSLALADLLQGDEASLQHLEMLASASTDPAVYAWAFGACSNHADCTLSAARWAQLDPGNLVPWEWEAAHARAASDPQAQADAVFRIAGSTRSNYYQGERLQLLLTLSEADSEGLQMAAESGLMSAAAWREVLPLMQGVTSQCMPPRTAADPAQASLCLAASEAMWKTSDNLMQSQISIAIGRRAAPQDKQRWISRVAEIAKLMTQARQEPVQGAQSSPCALVLNQRRHLQALAASGELGALRRQQQTVKSID